MVKKQQIKKPEPRSKPPAKRVYQFIIVLFAVLLYINTLPNNYNLDDELVTKNQRLTSKGIKALPEIFTSQYYKDKQGYAYEYRPVTLATFAIEHQFFGDNAGVSHFFNLLIYVITCLLLFKVLKLLFESYGELLPFIITLLFTAHPLHTEAVANIKSRDELLSLLGGIAALHFAVLFIRNGKLTAYLLAVLCFALGVMSKLSVVPFALVIPLALVIFCNASLRRLLLVSTALALFAAFFAPIGFLYQKILFFIGISLFPALFYVDWQKVYRAIIDTFKWLITFSTVKRNFNPTGIFRWVFFSMLCIIPALTITFNWQPALYGYLVIIGFLYTISDTSIKPVMLLVYGVVVAITAFMFDYEMVAELAIVAFIIIFFWDAQKVKYYALVCLALSFAVLWYIIGKVAIGPLIGYLLIFYMMSKPKWSKYSLIILTLVLCLDMYNLIFDVNMKFEIRSIIGWIVGLSLLLLFVTNWSRYIIRSYILLVPAMMLLYFIILQTNPTYFNKSNTYIPLNQLHVESTLGVKIPQVDIAAVQSPSLLPSSYRTLDFAEMPLKNTDPLNIRLGTAFYVLGDYLKLLFIPYQLSFYYGYKQVPLATWTHYRSLDFMLVYLALFIISIVFFRKYPPLSFGIITYISCIMIFSNIPSPVAGLMADRFAYVASVGFCIALGYLLLMLFKIDMKQKLGSLLQQKSFVIVTGLILTLYTVRTVARNMEWKDHLTLFRSDINHLENSAQANNLLAENLIIYSFDEKSEDRKQGMLKEAVVHFKKALEVYPDFFNASFDLGRANLLLNNMPDARDAFKNCFRIDSTFAEAPLRVGATYYQEGKFREAIPWIKKATEVTPNYLEAWRSLSMIYFKEKDYPASIAVNLEIINRFTDHYEPLTNIGKAYFNLGDMKNALIYFEQAYKLNPNDRDLVMTIANLYKENGNKEKAEFYLSRVPH